MLKWLLTLTVAVAVLSVWTPRFGKYSLGRLPGDINLRYKGRDYYLPFTTTILLSSALALLTRIV
ncbi:MAG TPA: DUF2905 domain-containing protein [Burkholderiales bacterium]|jgi:hypothetical protein|nr:DUF2905 domain-containing protein [Burkholderiales bacterium]